MPGHDCFESKQTLPGRLNPLGSPPSIQSKADMSNKRFSWAVKPLTRRQSVPRALLLARPSHSKTITMPVRNMTVLTDEDVGLTPDPIAQERAEEYIRAAISYRLKAQAKATPIQAVEIPVADESISILDVPADVLDGIAAELRRIASLPARL